ncbi:hypothetical protein Scep_002807 [Stephania cephalantha]|uniref:WAT1-related protein n=1 Tax=Stephania cephalantha TaxID=152367 RepID=A0AAP0LAX5_9MAGN
MENRGPVSVVLRVLKKKKPHLAMVLLQFGYAGMFIVTVLCLKRGLSHYVLAVYRHAIATIAIAPFALVLERNVRPKMTIKTFVKIIALALLELEKVKMKDIHSQAKILGTIITIAGAMTMTLYKGPILTMFMSSKAGENHRNASTASGATTQHWLAGILMLLGGCTGWSAFFILQSFTIKEYPAELSLSAWICFLGTVLGSAVSLVMERDFRAWAVGFDSRLLAPVYTGVVCSGMAYYILAVVIRERGPVFVTAFTPLTMVIVAALGSLILGELLHLGSVIGAIIIVVGLYSVLWGKRKDSIASSTFSNEKGGGHEPPVSLTNESTKSSTNYTSITAKIVSAGDESKLNNNGNVMMCENPNKV